MRRSSLGVHLLPSLEELLQNLVVPDGLWMTRRSASGRIPQWAIDEALGVPLQVVSATYSPGSEESFTAPLGGLNLGSWVMLGLLLGFLLLIVTLIVIAPAHPISSSPLTGSSSTGNGMPPWQQFPR